MITFEINSSPDIDAVRKFEYFQNDLTFGTSEQCSLIIEDPKLSKLHFFFQIKENGLFCKNLVEGDFYISNGKKISGGKIHQPGDEITIGETTIKILSFINAKKNYKEELKKKYEEIDIMLPEIQNILTELEKELVRIEGKINVSK